MKIEYFLSVEMPVILADMQALEEIFGTAINIWLTNN